MSQNKYLVVLPGIILAFVLYSLSQGFNNIIGIELLGYNKSPISTAMIAILLGIFFGNAFTVRDGFQKGLDFTREYILKLGIIFLGIQLKPFEFLDLIKQIENMLGRKESRIKNMPRTIDIDILVHGSSIMETKELIIPHPGLINRKFVLIPFDEIATDFKIPHINMTVNELLVRCTDKAFVKLYELENKA